MEDPLSLEPLSPVFSWWNHYWNPRILRLYYTNKEEGILHGEEHELVDKSFLKR